MLDGGKIQKKWLVWIGILPSYKFESNLEFDNQNLSEIAISIKFSVHPATGEMDVPTYQEASTDPRSLITQQSGFWQAVYLVCRL